WARPRYSRVVPPKAGGHRGTIGRRAGRDPGGPRRRTRVRRSLRAPTCLRRGVRHFRARGGCGGTSTSTTRRHCMARADKAAAVAEIAERFKEATATVVTEYRGLTTADLAELRRAPGESASYRVAKNTLVQRAAEEAGIEGLDELFSGPTAIAFVTGEPVDAAKAIKKFAKDNKALVIKGGYMDGRPLSVAEIE